MLMKMLLILFFSFQTYAQSLDVNIQNIEVIGHQEGSTLIDFIPSVTKLQGKELTKKRQTSLGDTLQSEVGVNSTQFGPSASRPVIRGLDGPRIRILQNSLGTLDASTQSLDHAVPVDTLTLDSIEIVRGPMGLIYGSSAVGGVVNLVTNRIHSHFEVGTHSTILTQGESINHGISSGLSLDHGVNNWMLHFDGSTRNLQNQNIPDGSSLKEIPNSQNHQDSLAGGFSKIFERGYLGVSYNFFDTNYGTVAEEDVTIKMQQNRVELHGEYRPYSSLFSKIRLRSAQSSYNHKELEGDEVGTIFDNKGNETRLEFINKKNEFNGISGIQTQFFAFEAQGDEAFLPKSDNLNIAIFTYQELKNNNHTFSFGGRLESAHIKKESSTSFGAEETKDFTLYNLSLGHQYKINSTQSFSTSFSYTERNANFQELYADGAHIATGTFEQGNSQLGKEQAYALELSFKQDTSVQKTTMSIYAQKFHHFIFLAPTGATDGGSGLPIYDYESADALFYGAEFENKRKLMNINKGELNFIGKFDFVRAKNTQTSENLPRVSPARVSAGIEYQKDRSATDLEVQHVLNQNKTAVNETSTPHYTLTNLGYSYDIVKNSYGINMFARLRNIFNVTARNHVSTLKDLAPLPGRNFILGAQMIF
jgi:iron complex outermembrane receptor protein